MLRCLVVHCGEVAKMLPNNFRNNILCLKRLNFIIYKLIQEAWVIIWLESFNCQENENYSFAFLMHASINLGVIDHLCLPIQTFFHTSFFKNRMVRRNLVLWAFKARYNVHSVDTRKAHSKLALMASLEGKKVSRERNNLLSNVREGRKK